MSDKETVCAVLFVTLVVGSIIGLMAFLQYNEKQVIETAEKKRHHKIDDRGLNLKLKNLRYRFIDQKEWDRYVDNLVTLAKYGTTKKDRYRLFHENKDFWEYELYDDYTKVLKNKMKVVENQVKRLEESK